MKKKIYSLLLSTALLTSSFAAVPVLAADDAAQEESSLGIWPEVAGEDGTSYQNLFEVILDDNCKDYWHDFCVEAVGEENADATVEALQASISADIYGEEAVKAYENSENYAFDCWYINEATAFTFYENDGLLTADIEKTDGSTETRTYEYLGVYQIGGDETMTWNGQEISPAFDCDVYQSTDDAGEFSYFFLRDDTMEETYHIEFRYGKDLEELQGYLKGDYAYWLAAGIDKEADEETIQNVIELFCSENVG